MFCVVNTKYLIKIHVPQETSHEDTKKKIQEGSLIRAFAVKVVPYEGVKPILEPFFKVCLRHDRGLVTMSTFRSV